MEAGLSINYHLSDLHVGEMLGLKVRATAIRDEAVTDVIDIADRVAQRAIGHLHGRNRAGRE